MHRHPHPLRRALRPALALLFTAACAPAAPPPADDPAPDGPAADSVEVSFETSDGVRVFADFHDVAGDGSAPLILLFHQAGGDARGEYGPIVPRLVDAGFRVLAVDQRAGGDRFGGVNRTMAARGDDEAGYCDAYPDLTAALDWAIARGLDGPRFAWGSSYSAALAMKLGAERGRDLAGVLAFSPASGEPMRGCDPAEFAGDIRIPVLALRPPAEAQSERGRAQIAAFDSLGIRTYVAAHGTHGSSMLVADRVDGDVEPAWAAVLDFLRTTAAAARTPEQVSG